MAFNEALVLPGMSMMQDIVPTVAATPCEV